MERSITFSSVMSALRRCSLHRRLPDRGSWRDEQGIVRVEKTAVHRLQLLHWRLPVPRSAYLNPVTKVADKCDFCAETRLAKAFRPFASVPARNTH